MTGSTKFVFQKSRATFGKESCDFRPKSPSAEDVHAEIDGRVKVDSDNDQRVSRSRHCHSRGTAHPGLSLEYAG